jgi:tetratricopeptide (TPR) repeat protein
VPWRWRCLLSRAVVVLCGLLSAASGWSQGADEHLLAGASAFREARYDQALVEFKVAHKLGTDPDVLWYLAATLTHLKRSEEALEMFARAQAQSPAGRDALLDYYEAVASYDAKLYQRANVLLSRVGKQAGPRIVEQTRKLKSLVAPVLKSEPSPTQIDWYVNRSQALLKQKRASLARAFLEEAQTLGKSRKDCHACEQVQALWKSTGELPDAGVPQENRR